MEKEFILPEKWYIEVTDDNREIINNWKIKQKYNKSLYHYDYKYVNHEGEGSEEGWSAGMWWCFCFTKITDKQFKKYVLKQSSEYLDPTKEESLLEKGKRLYPIGTRYIPLSRDGIRYGDIYKVTGYKENEIGLNFGFGWVYLKETDEWAEIVTDEKKHSSPEPITKTELTSNNPIINGIELIPNGYYKYNDSNIFQYDYYKDNRYYVKNQINISDKSFKYSNNWWFLNILSLSIATQEEIEHLEQCKTAGKYVEYTPNAIVYYPNRASYRWKILDFNDFYPEAKLWTPTPSKNTENAIKPILIDVPRI